MFISKLYLTIGCILVFVGLFSLILPHAYHEKIAEELGQHAEEGESHLAHTFEGAIVTVLGIIFLALHERRELRGKKY